MIGRPRIARPRRGSILPYAVVSIVALIGVTSLAVDWGHVQMVKSDMRRTADATARGYLDLYVRQGQASANLLGPALYSNKENPVDSNSGVTPTVLVEWGSWDPSSRAFTPGSMSINDPAVRVTVSRTTAGNNSIPLAWASVLGDRICNVTVKSVAAALPMTGTVDIPSTADPYLAGMPAGSTASYDDTTSNAPAYQVTSVQVIPGSQISLSNLAGQVRHDPTLGWDGPSGEPNSPSTIIEHGSDSPVPGGTPRAENGIGDSTMPLDAVCGVFLNDDAPNTTAPPAATNYSTAASRNQASNSSIQLKQPFYVGDGQTTSGATMTFTVPPGATRLFLSIWDGHEWENNGGSFTGNITTSRSVQLVQ